MKASFLFTLALALSAGAAGCGSSDAASSGPGGGHPGAGGFGGDFSGAGGMGAGTGGSGGGGLPGAWCTPIPTCDAPPPDPGPALAWNHTGTQLVVLAGAANHRGRDLFLNPGDPQWVIAKFAYGLTDKDLKDEQVDLYLLRDCGDMWEFLGSTMTTEESPPVTVEGVVNSGGRVFFEIPPDKALAAGRHRVHLVVRGDLTGTDALIEVVPPGAPMFVSDVDGTLTGTETEEFTALLQGQLPDVHPDAAQAFHILVSKGYHPMYMTARPEWLVGRTREFIAAYGFPPGIVHTTLSLTGATGSSASGYKTGELALLAGKGLVPAWAFGNTETDAEAYDNGGVMPLDHRVFYQFEDSVHGGRTVQSYTELLAELEALPSLCD